MFLKDLTNRITVVALFTTTRATRGWAASTTTGIYVGFYLQDWLEADELDEFDESDDDDEDEEALDYEEIESRCD